MNAIGIDTQSDHVIAKFYRDGKHESCLHKSPALDLGCQLLDTTAAVRGMFQGGRRIELNHNWPIEFASNFYARSRVKRSTLVNKIRRMIGEAAAKVPHEIFVVED